VRHGKRDMIGDAYFQLRAQVGTALFSLLRLATEAWVCRIGDAPDAPPWVAVQAVVFNLSDDPAAGQFYFAVRPFNPASRRA